jgi:hypothetical protein
MRKNLRSRRNQTDI